MDKNKYAEIIGARLEFIPKHWRFITFVTCVIFLFYILTLSINVIGEINRMPNSEDIDKKFSTVKIRKDVLNEIEKFFSEKENIWTEYSQTPPVRNPFLPYTASSSEAAPSLSPSISPNSSPGPSSAPMP